MYKFPSAEVRQLVEVVSQMKGLSPELNPRKMDTIHRLQHTLMENKIQSVVDLKNGSTTFIQL